MNTCEYLGCGWSARNEIAYVNPDGEVIYVTVRCTRHTFLEEAVDLQLVPQVRSIAEVTKIEVTV